MQGCVERKGKTSTLDILLILVQGERGGRPLHFSYSFSPVEVVVDEESIGVRVNWHNLSRHGP